MKKTTITAEQNEIIQTELSPGSILRVIAFAGTGKTTTLVEYTKKRPHLRFLYVAFNKSVEMEAKKKFPGNVTCKTSHALAFRTHGAKDKNRLVARYRAHAVMQALRLNEYEEAKFVIETLTNYLVSADAEIVERHTPPLAAKKYRNYRFVYQANRLKILMHSGKNKTIGIRKKILISEIESRLKILLVGKAEELALNIEKMEIMPDHVLLFIKATSVDSPH
jgi:F-box protein, helicase, 18